MPPLVAPPPNQGRPGMWALIARIVWRRRRACVAGAVLLTVLWVAIAVLFRHPGGCFDAWCVSMAVAFYLFPTRWALGSLAAIRAGERSADSGES